MYDWKRGTRTAAALLAIAVFCGLTLMGCKSNPGEAEAQTSVTTQRGQQIETFVIDPESFALLTNQPPTVEISDQATTYTLQSDGNVTFTLLGATTKTIALDPEDMVIERPFAGTVTVIRDR
ncbi:MAG TPA: hypothetical protein VIG57_02105 [Candidatus Entotheonella sp.]|jgi:hypothetical protein